MELAVQIKEHRTQLGMSQDELAARVYVSRQTISNWECDKTYPDVQSLLLLSNVFGTTVDALIKGDVETMEKILNNDVRRLGVLSVWMTVLLIAAVVLLFCTAWRLCCSLARSWAVRLAILWVSPPTCSRIEDAATPCTHPF